MMPLKLTPEPSKVSSPSGMTVGTRGPMSANRGFNKANQLSRALALRRKGTQQGQVRSPAMPEPVAGLGTP